MFHYKCLGIAEEIIDGVSILLFYLLGITPIIIPLMFMYFMVYGSYRWIMLLYLIWIWKDRKTAERGGRRIERIRGWSPWTYLLKYFQTQFVVEETCQLDPKQNYIFCFFPHGVFPVGMICMNMKCEQTEQFLPFHTPSLCTANALFFLPFTRELLLSYGGISASEESIKYILTARDRGNVVCLSVGGASEISHSKPNTYKIILKKRKGFARIALQTGTPLVPVISFNETSVFDQFSPPVTSGIQEYWRKIFSYPLILPIGSYIIFPRRVQITVLVGRPIEVKKNPSPTKEEIDGLHQQFVEKLSELFENNKYKYVPNPDKTFLEIV